MECARVAAGRGHRVSLVERAPRLGGTARFSALTTPANGDLVRWFEAALAEAGVEVRCGTDADRDLVASLEPDVVLWPPGLPAPSRRCPESTWTMSSPVTTFGPYSPVSPPGHLLVL